MTCHACMLRFLAMGTKPKYRIEILGPEVTLRRKRLALTKEQLAEKTGVSFSRLNKIEAGLAGGVGEKTVQKLCAFFECQPEDISQVLERSA